MILLKALTPNGECMRFSIVHAHSNAYVGGISVWVDPSTPRIFSYGIALSPVMRGKGYAQAALTKILQMYFVEKGFALCKVQVYADNAASLSLHEKLGFTQSKQFTHPKDGRYTLLYTLCAQTFLTNNQ